tara:strand:- start:11624 stop:11821 length:198 start_codon:yes stop_codon:yes gene_type:complete
MTYSIRKRKKNGKDGYQIVAFMLPTYFTLHGYPPDKHDVKDGWFEELVDAEIEAMNLEMDEEYGQ